MKSHGAACPSGAIPSVPTRSRNRTRAPPSPSSVCGRHRPHRCADNVMGKNDRPAMGAADDPAGDDRTARSAPILRVHRPQHRGQAAFGIDQPALARRQKTVGGTHGDGRAPDSLVDHGRGAVKLAQKRRVTKPGQSRMGPGVVPDLVPLGRDPSGQFRVHRNAVTDRGRRSPGCCAREACPAVAASGYGAGRSSKVIATRSCAVGHAGNRRRTALCDPLWNGEIEPPLRGGTSRQGRRSEQSRTAAPPRTGGVLSFS